jgi:hypothetical protein
MSTGTVIGPRIIKTTYYGQPERKGGKKPVVKVTYGSNPLEALPNVTRRMVRNLDGAVVASVEDTEYGELLLVATYFIGESFKVQFERDVTRPVCVTNIED